MADKIRLLPEVVANQIAAGEVVNYPSSVVKELMENAIDAGARRVTVNFRNGGRELIQVVDDGCGLSPIDARLAFDRHATSKIRSVEEIYSLATFGFRGEALASIAAVAQVELRTRQEGDEVGTLTEINGGRFVRQEPTMCPVGAQFYVRNLFYNIPVRRNFQESVTTSSRRIREEFRHVALCYPQIAFELYTDDAPYYTLRTATLAERIVDVVGRGVRKNMLEVGADTSIARVEGFIGRPAAARKRNSEQYLFVNGRYFKSPYLQKAILKAYEKLIPESEQPSYFLYLKVDPSRIDVNVHPQKIEVRFSDEEAIWQIIQAAVRETLAKSGAVPMMDFDRTDDVEIPVYRKGVRYSEPRAVSDEGYNPFRESYIDSSAPDPNVAFTGFDVPYPGSAQTQERPSPAVADSVGTGFRADADVDADVAPMPRAAGPAHADLGLEFEEIPSGEQFDEIASRAEQFDFVAEEGDEVEQRLDMRQQLHFDAVLSAAGGCAVASADGRLFAVDLRRARERVLYEEYLPMVGRDAIPSQQLLFPERLLLSEAEYALLEEHAVDVAALGFDLDLCGYGAVEVKGTPADLPADAVDTLLYDVLQAFSMPVSLGDARRERIAATLARCGARCGGGQLQTEQARLLLDRLAASSDFSFTPSGKAILAEITAEDLRAKLG